MIGRVENDDGCRGVRQSDLHCSVVWDQSNKVCFKTAQWKIVHLGTRSAGHNYGLGLYCINKLCTTVLVLSEALYSQGICQEYQHIWKCNLFLLKEDEHNSFLIGPSRQ